MAKIGFYDAYGFQSNATFSKKFNKATGLDELTKNDKIQKAVNGANTFKNITQIAGYIPVLGTIMALVKLIVFKVIPGQLEKLAKDDKMASYKSGLLSGAKLLKNDFAKGMNIRIIFEMLSLGFILVITDFICTAGNSKGKEKA